MLEDPPPHSLELELPGNLASETSDTETIDDFVDTEDVADFESEAS